MPSPNRDAHTGDRTCSNNGIKCPLGLQTSLLPRPALGRPRLLGPGPVAWDPGWDHRERPAELGEHLHTLRKPLHSHRGQWRASSALSRGPGSLGQFACTWKRTFLGINDERAVVFSLQPAVTVYEVSHVLGFCQRGGFDGQRLQRRDQPRIRPQSPG